MSRAIDPLSRFRQLLNIEEPTEPQTQTQENAVYHGLLPVELTEVQRRATTDLQKRLSEITFNIPELPPELADIPPLTSKDDFPDDYWKDHESIELAILPERETVNYGRELFSNLSHGISQYHVGLIFVLSYQLRKPGAGTTSFVMPDKDELHHLWDWPLVYLDRTVDAVAGNIVVPTEIGTESEIACGYAFLAASMLQMFTRPAENYERSWNQVTEGYRKFYSKALPVTGILPEKSVLQAIHGHFELSDIMKETLYRYLYNANRNGEVLSIQKFLYDMHLSHTGMHVVPIAYEICMEMNCSPDQLMRVMNAGRFRPQITSLVAAFKLMKNSDEKHIRQMWKYGRIFDPEFFASLQTRRCAKFVYL